jgi:hypothetical protein
MAIGAFPSIYSTILRAFASVSSNVFTTWDTSPSFCAYSPLTLLPVKINSLASDTPIVLAKVCVPPPPGIKLQ